MYTTSAWFLFPPSARWGTIGGMSLLTKLLDFVFWERPRNPRCSFCRKSCRQVGPLVEGARDAFICGTCIEFGQSVLAQEKRRRGLILAVEHASTVHNETEYKEAVARLAEERKRFSEHRDRLKQTGLADEDIKRVMDPMESFHLQLQMEVESYERLKRGEFIELEGIRGLGRLLISLRIAQGVPQRELAQRL